MNSLRLLKDKIYSARNLPGERKYRFPGRTRPEWEMDVTVSTATIVCMLISCLIGFAIPIGLYIFFRKTVNAETAPFFIGCGTFLIFALVLESGLHQFILGTSFGETIRNNTLYYAIYGGLCAGIFEEFGRLICFRTLLKSYMYKDSNALMYGAGHGGLEAMMVLGVTMINNIAYSSIINKGELAKYTATMAPDAEEAFRVIINQLITAPSWQFLLGGIERIIAIILQISLTVLVWMAVTRKHRFYYFPLAILIHTVVDAVPVILSGNGMNVPAVEAILALMAAAVALLARKVWTIERAG